MSPRAGGPPAHFHRTFSESFFVLCGSVEVDDGRAWSSARSGDFLHVPEGGVHGFRNVAGDPASMLILFAPGAPREAYFKGLAARGDGRWSPTEDELRAFFAEHDTYFL